MECLQAPLRTPSSPDRSRLIPFALDCTRLSPTGACSQARIWMIMSQYGIPQKIINIVKELYDGFECAVVEEDATSEWFELTTGVKQGCTMSGFLFLLIIDWVMRHTVKEEGTGLRWKFTSKLEDLDLADDVALISSTQRHVQLKTNRLVENAARTGLRVNVGKCKVMRVNARNNEAISQ